MESRYSLKIWRLASTIAHFEIMMRHEADVTAALSFIKYHDAA